MYGFMLSMHPIYQTLNFYPLCISSSEWDFLTLNFDGKESLPILLLCPSYISNIVNCAEAVSVLKHGSQSL